MHLSSSQTQVFYHFIDLDDQEKQQYLLQLEQDNPELYHQLSLLINNDNEQKHLTQLLHFGAELATNQDVDLSGEVINKYRLLHELGRGGMGVVYAAQRADETFEQELAIKFIQHNLSNVLGQRSLFDEAQLLARLNHPFIAKVYDGGLHNETVYIVMERVFGQTLNTFLSKTSLSYHEKLQLFSRICQAVEHAHQNQVLHADLKPENILIDAEHHPKLLDFNLTQKFQEGQNQPSSSLVAYSPKFASPEQKKGQPLTVQSDVYSLGKILTLMFPSPPWWSDIYWVIRRATRPDAPLRYPSVKQLQFDIERILAHRPIEQKKYWPFYGLLRLIQRRPMSCSLSAIIVISGLVFGQALVEKNLELQQEKQIAEDMMYELTRLIFHAKGQNLEHLSVNSMMELTRRRVLSNPHIPQHIKQKMLLAMMTPVPEKHLTSAQECHTGCDFDTQINK